MTGITWRTRYTRHYSATNVITMSSISRATPSARRNARGEADADRQQRGRAGKGGRGQRGRQRRQGRQGRRRGAGEGGDSEGGGDSGETGVVAAEMPLSLLRLPPPSLLRLLCAPCGSRVRMRLQERRPHREKNPRVGAGRRPPNPAMPKPARAAHTPDTRAALVPSLAAAVAVLRHAVASAQQKSTLAEAASCPAGAVESCLPP